MLLLRRGTAEAQGKAAAAIAAAAAAGADEASQLVGACGVAPLLLLLRAKGDAQEHAARAIMSMVGSARTPPLSPLSCPPLSSPPLSCPTALLPTALLPHRSPAHRERPRPPLPPQADSPEHQASLSAAGAIPAAVGLLRSGSLGVQDVAAGILGSLAIQSEPN